MQYWAIVFSVCFGLGTAAQAEEISFTILSTGDLHSRFEPHVDPFHLGGMARLKTAMDQVEAASISRRRPVLKLDAGDCTEGGILFNLGGGVASYELLNLLGYDAITLGNHDWYLGPDTLNEVLEQAPPQFSFLSGNLNWRNIPEHPLQHKLKEYEVFYLVDGAFVREGENGFEPQPDQDYFKVGVFGVSTNEVLFTFLVDPVEVTAPFISARRTVSRLRRENVDVVVMLSHLLDEDDMDIAQRLAGVDIVIGGHSHHKVIPVEGEPISIRRDGDDPEGERTWVVKQAEYGQFLGQMNLVYDTETAQMRWPLSTYELIQIDHRFSEDSVIQARISEFKSKITEKYARRFLEVDGHEGNIFSDHIAESEIDLFRNPENESYLGNCVTNAILERARPLGATFSINNSGFLTHSLYRGILHSAMIYDALPHIYNPETDKSWTVWTVDISGRDLKKAIDLILSADLFFDVAGLEVVYDPTQTTQKVQSIRLNGSEIVDDQRYIGAGSGGIVDALRLLMRIRDELVDVPNFTDTGIEIWEVFRKYMQVHSPLRADDPDIRVTGRMRTVQPDVAVFSEDTVVTRSSSEAGREEMTVRLQIRNLGYGGLLEDEAQMLHTYPTRLHLFYDQTPENVVDDIEVYSSRQTLFGVGYERWSPLLDDQTLPGNVVEIGSVEVPSLRRDEAVSVSLNWNTAGLPRVTVPYTLYARVDQTLGTVFDEGEARDLVSAPEVNLHNNKAQIFVYLPQE